MIPNTLPQGLIDNPRLDQWIGFEEHGYVRVSTGKVELGQGILTAIVQLAADELDVDAERIRIVSGDTQSTPAEGSTVGSLSVQNSGGSVRLAAAEIRSLMLDAAASRLGCARDALTLQNGKVLRDGQMTGLDYWVLARSVDLKRGATGTATPKSHTMRRYIGKSFARIDLPGKLAPDAPVFIHDLAMPGMLHARVLRQPWPDAELQVSDRDLAAEVGGLSIVRERNFLALVGEDERAVVRAAERLAPKLMWSGGKPIADASNEPGWVVTQPATSHVSERGAKTASSLKRLVRTYNKQFIAHASIGPACAVAHDDGVKLTVWTQSQGVGPLRAMLARMLARAVATIHVRHVAGAGCYGHNGADDVAADAAAIAVRMHGRAVRVQFSREDELTSAPLGSAMQVTVAATLDERQMPVGWQTEIWSCPHAQRPGLSGNVNLAAYDAMTGPGPRNVPEEVPEAAGGSATRNAWLLYDVPYQSVTNNIVANSGPRTSSMRGLGAFANVFAIENFMDELAAEADIDPIQYRLRLVSDPRARAVIERAARMASWTGPRGKADGRGRGFAYSRYKNRAGYCALVVDVTVDEQVRLEKIWCAVDAGLSVNPDGVANQVEGGIIQAASWTLKEAVRFEGGRIACRTWDDYPILTFPEIPPIEIEVIQHPEAPMLGVGEVSQGPTGAAIGNAVADALGVRIRDLPLTRERLMKALA